MEISGNLGYSCCTALHNMYEFSFEQICTLHTSLQLNQISATSLSIF